MTYKEINYIDRKTGNIVKENIPGEKYLKFLYCSPFGKLPLHLLVKRKILSSLYGHFMDSKNSCKKILPFVKQYSINMDLYQKKIEDYSCFNDFFYRKMKPDSMDVDMDPNILVSSASGRVLAFDKIEISDNFFVKGSSFSLDRLFGNKDKAASFYGGAMIIIRLAPVDYHRFHFPTSGIISENTHISGDYYSVSPLAVRQNIDIFFENKREYSILSSDTFGDIALFEIGATMVGGIKQTFIPNTQVKKGDEKGYFYFGGSTCIMIVQKNRIKIDNDILNNSSKGLETLVSVGERLACLP